MSNFSIYDILHEAPEDQNAGGGNEQQQNNDTDNFDIDTSLDDLDNELDADSMDLDAEGGEDTGEGDMGTEDDGSIGGGELGSGEEDEPVEANTDMFSSLTAKEQAIKISQLKKQFLTLYNNCDDLIEKVKSIETDENNIIPISRINSTMETLKTYIADYLYHQFADKSFFDNDVMFNRFLSIFKAISNILIDVYKETNRENQQNK